MDPRGCFPFLFVEESIKSSKVLWTEPRTPPEEPRAFGFLVPTTVTQQIVAA